jgi:uncharacterized coiled-coil protein SlyX
MNGLIFLLDQLGSNLAAQQGTIESLSQDKAALTKEVERLRALVPEDQRHPKDEPDHA